MTSRLVCMRCGQPVDKVSVQKMKGRLYQGKYRHVCYPCLSEIASRARRRGAAYRRRKKSESERTRFRKPLPVDKSAWQGRPAGTLQPYTPEPQRTRWRPTL